MKKKLFNVVLLVAVVIAASASFISCTDKTGDDYNNLAACYLDLASVVDAQNQTLQAQLDALKAAQEECKSSCQAKQADLQNQIDILRGMINELNEDSIKSLRQQVQDLKDEVAALQAQDVLFQTAINNINTTLNEYNTRITNNENNIVTLTNLYNTMNQTLITVQQDLAAVKDLANSNKEAIDKLTEKFNDYYTKSEINSGLDTLNNKLTALETKAAEAQARADAAYAYAEANKTLIDQLTDKFNNYYTKEEIDSMKAEVEQQVAEAKAEAEAAQAAAEAAQATADAAYTLALEALAKADANATKIYELEQALAALVDQVAQSTDIAALREEFNEKLAEVQKDLSEKIDQTNLRIDDLKQYVDDRVEYLQEQIDELNRAISALDFTIRSMVTSVVLQGAYSPVIGQFALPVGLQSNILFCYFGNNSQSSIHFPIDVTNANGDNIDLSLVESPDDYEINNGEELVSDIVGQKAYLGTVYTTINPNSVNFEGKKIQIVNSQDCENKVYLEPLKRSDAILSFGYTRTADNGFYEADAYIPANDVENIRITKNIDKDQLKATAKTVLNKIRNKSISGGDDLNLSNVYKMILENVSGVLPAYGLKATWVDSDEKQHCVYSNYNLAATSVKPLSYDFDKTIRNLPHIGEVTFDVDFHLDYPEYQYIENPNLELTVYVVKTTVVIGVYSDKTEAEECKAANPGSDIETMKFTVSGLQSFIDTINNDIIQKLTNDIKDLEDQITSQTQSNVNRVTDKINTKIISRVNSWIDKLNVRLQNLNHYLQPTMLVQGNNNTWYLAPDNWLTPHPYYLDSHGYALFEPTSYTAEIFAPAYKKYVACTNVFETGNPAVSAKLGDAECKRILKEANQPVNANGAVNMNTVFEGNKDVAANLAAEGYTYEITYACVDYSGYTRFTKCYVKTLPYNE